MELTNLEINTHLNSLKAVKTKVEGKLAFAVAKNIRRLSTEIIEFENVKNDLIKKYGSIGENGQFGIKIGTESYDLFMNEIKEYCDIKQDVNILKVDEDTICSSSLNADEILNLDFMIIDDEQD